MKREVLQGVEESACKQRRAQQRIHQSNIPKEISLIKQFKGYGEELKIERIIGI